MANAAQRDEMLPDRLRSCLRTRFFGAEIQHFRQLESTQTTATEAAQRGAGEGTLILAEAQTRGRGRHGHDWASPPGAGIYASLVLRPPLAAREMLWLTLAAGLALADAVEEVAGLVADLRWPNDLLLGGKKFCGALVEASVEGERLAHAILGFGINVRVRPLPPGVTELATALEAHTRQPVSRLLLCA
ncbi:MAG: biotin--[acetyl-CoA-carboxylase] ligase, partial [Terriglobales bacterium]